MAVLTLTHADDPEVRTELSRILDGHGAHTANPGASGQTTFATFPDEATARQAASSMILLAAVTGAMLAP